MPRSTYCIRCHGDVEDGWLKLGLIFSSESVASVFSLILALRIRVHLQTLFSTPEAFSTVDLGTLRLGERFQTLCDATNGALDLHWLSSGTLDAFDLVGDRLTIVLHSIARISKLLVRECFVALVFGTTIALEPFAELVWFNEPADWATKVLVWDTNAFEPAIRLVVCDTLDAFGSRSHCHRIPDLVLAGHGGCRR